MGGISVGRETMMRSEKEMEDWKQERQITIIILEISESTSL